VLQTACQLSYVDNNDDERSNDSAEHLLPQIDDVQQVESEPNEHVAVKTDDIRQSPESLVLDDSQSPTDTEQYLTMDSAATDR